MQHNATKVSLSKEEYELVNDARILLTKREIIGKVYTMFGALAEEYVATIKDILPAELLQKSPKISRGENYEGLPYVMLDYPRHFLKEEIFAIRTFFWWGNFFSITIQLSGSAYQRLLNKLLIAAEENLFDDWFVSVHENKWIHHFRETNYRTSNDIVNILQQQDSIKLAKKIPLSKWDDVSTFLQENFRFLVTILKS